MAQNNAEKTLDAHIFICTNLKENGECCKTKGSEELRDALKQKCKERPDWAGRIRVNASGCLGHCKEGITAVIYPQGEWYTKLQKDDTEKLFSDLEKILDSKKGD